MNNYYDDFIVTSKLVSSEPYYPPFKICYMVKTLSHNLTLLSFENFVSVPVSNIFKSQILYDSSLAISANKETAEKEYNTFNSLKYNKK